MIGAAWGEGKVTWTTVLLTYNLASLSGPNSAQARAQLMLSLMKQFRANKSGVEKQKKFCTEQ